jgi:membrane associated rhomboid family serine protease
LNWAEIPQRGAEACTLVFVIVLNLLTGMSGNIDNAAHGGGLVTGILCAPWILPLLIQKPNEKVIRGTSAVLTCGMYLLFILLIWLKT